MISHFTWQILTDSVFTISYGLIMNNKVYTCVADDILSTIKNMNSQISPEKMVLLKLFIRQNPQYGLCCGFFVLDSDLIDKIQIMKNKIYKQFLVLLKLSGSVNGAVFTD